MKQYPARLKKFTFLFLLAIFLGAMFSAPLQASLFLSQPAPQQQSQSEQQSQVGQKIEKLPDGTLQKEIYSEKGRRISKVLSSSDGLALKRWEFDAENGKILKYEVNEYDKFNLKQRRVATWKYGEDQAFVKTNQLFDSKGKPGKSFIESVNTRGVKYKEEWYDEDKRKVAEKLWNPLSGQFVSHVTTDYVLGGWATRTHLDENGKSIQNTIVTPLGKVLNAR